MLGLPGGPDPQDPRYKAIYDRIYNDVDLAHRAGQGGRPLAAGQSIDPANYAETIKGIEAKAAQEFAAQYPEAARTADPAYGSLLRKFSTADIEADPVYKSGLQFGLDQGTSAINARALQTGNYDSGATLKALTRYANDYGSTKAEGAYNRYNADNTNIFNKLSGISGTAQVAANQVGSAGTNATNQISGDLTGAGNARAAGIVGGANAWGSGITGVANAYNTYDQNQRYKKLTGYNSGSNMNATYGGQNLAQDDFSAGFY